MFRTTGRIVKRNLSRKAVKAHAILLNKFYLKYGLLSGLKLFLLFKLRRTERLRIPGIRFPFSLRPGTSDFDAFNHIFLDNNYSFRYPENPEMIIDGGANIGLFSIIMKNEYPNATIICIEPDPGNFHQLKNNLSPYDNIFFENCALWNHNTRGFIHNKFNLGNWGMVASEDEAAGNIQFVTLSSIFVKYRINQAVLLKLDIETSEKSVFSGSIDDWSQKVLVLIIELHDWIEPGCGSIFFRAINRSLKEYSYFVNGDTTVIINPSCQYKPHVSTER